MLEHIGPIVLRVLRKAERRRNAALKLQRLGPEEIIDALQRVADGTPVDDVLARYEVA